MFCQRARLGSRARCGGKGIGLPSRASFVSPSRQVHLRTGPLPPKVDAAKVKEGTFWRLALTFGTASSLLAAALHVSQPDFIRLDASLDRPDKAAPEPI